MKLAIRVVVGLALSLLLLAGATLVSATPSTIAARTSGSFYSYDPISTSTTSAPNVAFATAAGDPTPSESSGAVGVAFRSFSAAEDTTTLYRAVNGDEFNSAIESQKFSAGPNSMEGKWFAEQPSDALQWGQNFYGSEPFHILQTEVPSSYADSLFSNPNLDGIGPARYADDLGTLNSVHGGISEYTP